MQPISVAKLMIADGDKAQTISLLKFYLAPPTVPIPKGCKSVFTVCCATFLSLQAQHNCGSSREHPRRYGRGGYGRLGLACSQGNRAFTFNDGVKKNSADRFDEHIRLQRTLFHHNSNSDFDSRPA
jgi:hypothetical protein